MLSKDIINQAVKILQQGGLVIYPTDTAFGIGCRIDNRKAVAKVFQVRKRPSDQAVPVLVDSINMAENYLSPLPNNVRRLMKRYWPGALTIVYSCQQDKVLSLVRGNGKTLGVRMPDHKIALALIRSAGVPLLGPSANFHGEKTPYRYQDLDKNLVKLVDLIIPGFCTRGDVSTVVDCTKHTFKIIRQGAIKLENYDMF